MSRALLFSNVALRIQWNLNLKYMSTLGSCGNLQLLYQQASFKRLDYCCLANGVNSLGLLRVDKSLCTTGLDIQKRLFSTTPTVLKGFRIRMDEEERKKKLAEIEKMRQEKKPEGTFALLKYYVKRYWYIAIPVHLVSSIFWFIIAFLAVKSGVDVVALLEHIHAPDFIIEKVKNTPPNASIVVIALILCKIIAPLRYATTFAGIKLTFTILQNMGKLRTAKEVTFKMRSEYAKRSDKIMRRYNRFTKHGLRTVLKKKSNDSNGKK